MARYFSRESAQEGVDRINNSPEHLKLAKNLTGKIILIALNDPDGNDVKLTYTFDKGRCADWSHEIEPSPSSFLDTPFKPLVDGLARVSAQYQTFVKLDTGELEAADTVDSPDYKIEANMLMILPLMQAMDSWNRETRSLPKEY